MTDDDHITLEEAARIFFGGNIKKATLLAAIKRGELKATKVGRIYFTTKTNLRGMMACLAAQQGHDYGSTRSENPGLSSTDHASSARAAALMIAKELSGSSKPISARSSNRRLATIP